LAAARVEAAWELTRSVYETHELSNLVNDAGWALRQWGDARSHAVIEGHLAAQDHERRRHAVQLLLAQGRVFERLRDFKPDHVSTLLHLVGHDAKDARLGKPAQGYLDAPMVELALKWVKHKRVKGSAQYVLDEAPAELVAAARAQRRLPPARKPRARKLPDPAALLAGFDADPAQVLAELTRLKGAVREPALLLAAEEVARRAMQRVRAAVESIAAELAVRGYRFAGVPLGPPASAPELAALEQAVGPLPVVLHAAFAVLGDVDLRGTHPDLDPGWLLDPLCFGPITSVLDDALEHAGKDSAFELAIAPDAHGKAGFSGGRLTVDVPDDGFDAPIDRSGARGLVPLLRASLAAGGLPGLAKRRAARAKQLLTGLARAPLG